MVTNINSSFGSFPDLNETSDRLPDIDANLYRLAEYLSEGLNTALQEIHPNFVAVRSFVCYDAIAPNLANFPLLKVYRLKDSFTDFTSNSTGIISYCMSFPDVDKLPGIMRWVSKHLNRLLRLWSMLHVGCQPFININQSLEAEYRIMVNEMSQPVYAFLRFSFSFEETNGVD